MSHSSLLITVRNENTTHELRERSEAIGQLTKLLHTLMKPRDILAISRWQFPHSLSEEQKAEKEKLQKNSPAKPEGYNHELSKDVLAALDKFRGEWIDDSKHFGESLISHTHYSPFIQIKKKHKQPPHD